MRPASITMFDRLYLGAIALGAVNTAISYNSIMEQLAADPAVAELGMASSGYLIGSAAFGIAVSMLLWFLISRKANNIARWVLTIFVAFGALMIPFSLGTLPLAPTIMALINTIMQIAAIWFLFRPDAKAWFVHGPKGMDPGTFE